MDRLSTATRRAFPQEAKGLQFLRQVRTDKLRETEEVTPLLRIEKRKCLIIIFMKSKLPKVGNGNHTLVHDHRDNDFCRPGMAGMFEGAAFLGTEGRYAPQIAFNTLGIARLFDLAAKG